MAWTVSRGTAAALVRMNDRDSLGLDWLMDERGLTDADLDLPDVADQIRRHLEPLIAGVDRSCDRHLRDQTFESEAGSPLDRVAADLIAFAGVRPIIALALSCIRTGVCVLERDGFGTIAVDAFDRSDSPSTRTRVSLSPDVVWHSVGIVSVRGMPASTAAAVEGQPLRQAVSHPVLDPLDFKVIGTDVDTAGTTMLHVDHLGHGISLSALWTLEARRTP